MSNRQRELGMEGPGCLRKGTWEYFGIHDSWRWRIQLMVSEIVAIVFMITANAYCPLVSVLRRFSCVWLFAILWTIAPRLLCPRDSPGKKTGVGYHALLQRIFPTQGSNPCLLHLLHCQGASLPLVPPVSLLFCIYIHGETEAQKSLTVVQVQVHKASERKNKAWDSEPTHFTRSWGTSRTDPQEDLGFHQQWEGANPSPITAVLAFLALLGHADSELPGPTSPSPPVSG